MTTLNIRVAGMIEFPIYCLGIEAVLKKYPGIDFVGNSTMKKLKQFLKEQPTDVLLINTRKNTEFKQSFYQNIRDTYPDLKIVFFLSIANREEVSVFRQFAPDGLLLKSIDIQELIYAIKTVNLKGSYISQGISFDAIDDILEYIDQSG